MTQRICRNHNINTDNYQKVYNMIEKTLRQSGDALIKNGKVFLCKKKWFLWFMMIYDDDNEKYGSQLWEEGKLLLYALNKALVYLALPEILIEDLGLAIEGILLVLQFLVICLQLLHDHLQFKSLDSFRKDHLRIFNLFLLIYVVILPLQSLAWTLTLLQQMYLISINMIPSLW